MSETVNTEPLRSWSSDVVGLFVNGIAVNQC